MYLMYVDESGDTGLTGSPTDFFALSGIVVHEQRWRPFMDALVTFKRTMRAVHGLPVRAEIHASEFIKSPVHGLPRHVRLAILRNALDELAKLPDISITNVIVDKRNKAVGYDVFENAWRALFQRFENTLVYGNFPGGHRNDYGTVFTDATGGMQLVRLMRRMNVYNPVPHMGGGGYRMLPITKIIEDPHPKDSAEALAIQMADVCAYFLHQRFKPNSYIRRQSASLLLRPALARAQSKGEPHVTARNRSAVGKRRADDPKAARRCNPTTRLCRGSDHGKNIEDSARRFNDLKLNLFSIT